MLKRLEIQCVFKELVKDIVVKGQLYGITPGAYYFVGEGFILSGCIAPAAGFPGGSRPSPTNRGKRHIDFPEEQSRQTANSDGLPVVLLVISLTSRTRWRGFRG